MLYLLKPLPSYIPPQSESLPLADLAWRPDLRKHVHGMEYSFRFLRNTLSELKAVIENKFEVFEAMNRTCGLASLPDDVLAMIFDLTVNNIENEGPNSSKWRTAATLSHLPYDRAVLSPNLDEHEWKDRSDRGLSPKNEGVTSLSLSYSSPKYRY